MNDFPSPEQFPVDEVYSVEKVLKKRIRRGETQYLIKWRNYPNKYNTWEPEDNLLCPELLKTFEEDWTNKQGAIKKAEEEISQERTKRCAKLEPEKIIGVSSTGGYLMYLLKWKSVAEADLISSQQARIKCPELVIDFYEKHISWAEPESS